MLGEPPLEVLSLRDGDKREEVNQGRGAGLKEGSLGPVWALLPSAGIYLLFASQIPAAVFVFISVFITLFPGYLVCLGAGNASDEFQNAGAGMQWLYRSLLYPPLPRSTAQPIKFMLNSCDYD